MLSKAECSGERSGLQTPKVPCSISVPGRTIHGLNFWLSLDAICKYVIESLSEWDDKWLTRVYNVISRHTCRFRKRAGLMPVQN